MFKILKWSLALFVTIVLPLVFASCGDDDKDEPKDSNYSELIIGTWSDEATSDWYDEERGFAYGYEFKENGICYVHGSNYGNGKYQIFDNQLVITYKSYAYGEESTYTETLTIVKLTKNVLEIMDNYDSDSDVETYYRIK